MNQTADCSQAPNLWSIAEIERDTGLGKDTLRIWERRYGFPTPLRDARGDRMYDQPQLQRLIRIKQLLDSGHRPGKVVPLSLPVLEAMLQASCAPADQSDASADLDDWLNLLEQGQPAQLRSALQQPLQQVPEALTRWPLTLSADGLTLTYGFDTQKDDTGIAELLAALGTEGIHFKDLRSSESSLEEIFVGLVNAPQATPASTKVAA